jgi:hypothetical protein
MKRPNTLLKLAAVTSSVLLASGFVCYQTGLFHSYPLSTILRSHISSGTTQSSGTMMGGSKSKVLSENVGTVTPLQLNTLPDVLPQSPQTGKQPSNQESLP